MLWVEESTRLGREFSAKKWPMLAFLDTHCRDKPEHPYPLHCMEGNDEENLVPALEWLEDDPNVVIELKIFYFFAGSSPLDLIGHTTTMPCCVSDLLLLCRFVSIRPHRTYNYNAMLRFCYVHRPLQLQCHVAFLIFYFFAGSSPLDLIGHTTTMPFCVSGAVIGMLDLFISFNISNGIHDYDLPQLQGSYNKNGI
ncbi:hypothetical protein SUGI_0014510 [Cryptomeria japonica]|nr:hypothetical protein SUGI_0014510 [Cryptomeria japonica]